MEEVAGLLLMVASFSSFAYVFVKKGHVRVSLIIHRLPPKLRIIQELVIRFMLLFYMIVFTKLGYGFVVMSYRLDCHTADSGLYEVPWMAVMPLSGLIFSLILIISCVQYIKSILQHGLSARGSDQGRETIEEMMKAF
jgi:TRAP-type C4-dicarboxylate transport system permease small subunit